MARFRELRGDDAVNLRQRGDFGDEFRRNDAVERQDADRETVRRVEVATERHMRDVRAVFRRGRAQRGDDARLVGLRCNEERAVEMRVDAELVVKDQTRNRSAEQRARKRDGAFVRFEFDRNDRAKVAGFRAFFFDDFQTALLHHRRGADDADFFAHHAGQVTGAEGRGNERRIFARQFALIFDLAGRDGARRDLLRENAEAVRQVERTVKLGERFRVERREVDRLTDDAVFQVVDQEFDRFQRDVHLRFGGAGAEVRGADDVRTTEERALGVRFFRINVERDAAEFAGVEAADERVHVVNPAASAVDQAGALFHRVDFFIGNQVAGRVGQRRVNGQIVDNRQKFRDGVVKFDVQFLRASGGEVRVERDDLHIERFRELGDRLADAPHPDDTERFAAELATGELFAIPTTFDERLVRGAGVAAQRKHQRERLLGGRDGVPAGSVHDDDARAGRRFKVDIVDADAGASDRLEPFVAFERFGGDFDAAATDRAVKFGQRLAQFFAFEAGANFVFEPGVLHHFQTVFGQGVKNDNFRHWYSPVLRYSGVASPAPAWNAGKAARRSDFRFVVDSGCVGGERARFSKSARRRGKIVKILALLAFSSRIRRDANGANARFFPDFLEKKKAFSNSKPSILNKLPKLTSSENAAAWGRRRRRVSLGEIGDLDKRRRGSVRQIAPSEPISNITLNATQRKESKTWSPPTTAPTIRSVFAVDEWRAAPSKSPRAFAEFV